LKLQLFNKNRCDNRYVLVIKFERLWGQTRQTLTHHMLLSFFQFVLRSSIIKQSKDMT